MTTDKTPAPLATAKHGGCVQLPTSERERFEAYFNAFNLDKDADGSYLREMIQDKWEDWQVAWQAALSAQPSPAGQAANSQVVSRMVSTAPARIFLQIGDGDYSDEPFPHPVGEEITWCSDSIVESEVAYVRADLAARQPVGQEPVAHRLVTGDPKRKWMCVQGAPSVGVVQQAKDHGWEIELLYASPPAQAVDLPYALDADPAGIRARLCDVITGTLMAGAQGHTPPPAGHWAEPFWQAARADATAQAVGLGKLLPAVHMLVVSARTSGGTAGRDAHLCEALDRVEALLPTADSHAVGK